MVNARAIAADFPFESRFVEVHGSRMHYVDEGSGAPVLFLHGNPTSSYLWRNVIPHVAPVARAIAPDLVGMGRSEKPDIPYRFFDHVKYVEGFIEMLGLENVTLVVHDWGSALGFHYARRHEANVRGLAFMEAFLRPVRWSDFPPRYRLGFRLFRTTGIGWVLVSALNLFVNRVVPDTVVRDLSPEEMARYREPFLTAASRKPVLQWPREIPIEGHPADVHEAVGAYRRWLEETSLPKLFFHAGPGAICPEPVVTWAKERFQSLETFDLGAGIHFLQEDHPHEIGEAIRSWVSRLEH